MFFISVKANTNFSNLTLVNNEAKAVSPNFFYFIRVKDILLVTLKFNIKLYVNVIVNYHQNKL